MSFFKNLSVGERVRIEAQLVEWSKMKDSFGDPRIEPDSWTIDDLTVNIVGHVYLDELDFEKLPVKFGKVTGDFTINNCKNLTTLEGCPEEVGGYFDCDNCLKLTSLEAAPKKVGDSFYANNCGKKFTKTEVKKYCDVKGTIFIFKN